MHEVVAYAADEAESAGTGHCAVTLHPDAASPVADNGRGTDTRRGYEGRVIKKPVMATKDLRFFNHPDAQTLPDGHPRRGMSVVAALSDWLVHTNRRLDGAWQQRHVHGIPVTDLEPLSPDGRTGTTVRFKPGSGVAAFGHGMAASLAEAATPALRLSLIDLRCR